MELVTKPGHQAGQFDPESVLLSLLSCLPIDIGMCVCSYFLFPSIHAGLPTCSLVLSDSFSTEHRGWYKVQILSCQSHPMASLSHLMLGHSPVCSVWSASLVFVQVLRCSVPSPAPGSLHSPFFCLDSSLPPFHHCHPFPRGVCPSEPNASSVDCLRTYQVPSHSLS